MSNYLPLIVRDILQQTGWNENEVAVYSALLEKGSMNLTSLSHETSVGIPTLQYVLKKLTLKKMLAKNTINNKVFYNISDIEHLKKWVKGYAKKYIQFEDVVAKFIDQYDFNPQIFTPKVKFFEGLKGVKQSYRQMLQDCASSEIKCIFSGSEKVSAQMKDFLKFISEEFVPKRVKKGILSKNLVLENKRNIKLQQQQKENMSEIKFIPKAYFPMVNTEITLYDDYLHCMSFGDEGGFAIIVKDASLVSTLVAVYDLMWNFSDFFTAATLKKSK